VRAGVVVRAFLGGFELSFGEARRKRRGDSFNGIATTCNIRRGGGLFLMKWVRILSRRGELSSVLSWSQPDSNTADMNSQAAFPKGAS